MTGRLLSVRLQHEHDIVGARQRARQVAAALGFEVTDQTRIATAVSELARNAIQYGGGGTVEYAIEGSAAPQVLSVRITDSGRGIPRLDEVLEGRYRSSTGMGLGIAGTRRLMDAFGVESGAGGTAVTIKKILPRAAPVLTPAAIGRFAAELRERRPASPIEEVQQQNHELLRTLDELRARQEELERVNRELEDTNRGVVALYAELDERADHLRRADEVKTKFLSNMTHEFRTPVNSILALTGLLADRLAIPPEHKDEVFYIRKSAQQLSDIVDDLLDIAKVEAGKIEVRPAPFEVNALFGALRGMLRPLLVNPSVSLTFEDAGELPPMCSDESKVSQILRNLVSNALKYTERGEVRVTASLAPSRDRVRFAVADTGIGIPAGDVTRVFDEFAQIENPLQRRVKGTGLGLPLSKRLAELLGGSIAVDSTLGEGSTFTVVLPLVYRDPVAAAVLAIDPDRWPLLVVDESEADLLLYERALAASRFQAVPARSVSEALTALQTVRPRAIVVDARLQGQDAWEFLARLKRDAATQAVPVVMVSAGEDRQKGFALGADACTVKPVDRAWLLETLDALIAGEETLRVLTVDDEETFRFIIREMLSGPEYDVVHAASGREGLRLTKEANPDVILVDLCLSDMTGVEVCERLRDDPDTAGTPVLFVSSQALTADDQRRIGRHRPVLRKAALTRDALRAAIREAAAGAAASPGRGRP